MREFTAFKNSLLARVLLVVMAFLIMVLSSSAVMHYTLDQKLLRNAEMTMDDTQTLFSKILSEPETVIDLIAANIEGMYNRGAGFDAIKAYMDEASSPEFKNRISVEYSSIYGYFEGTGEFHDGSGWIPEPGYNPKERPWYMAASESGEIGTSEPYIDMSTSQHIISYSRRIFDASGNFIGVIGLDMFIDGFRDMVVNKRITPNSYGYMVDQNFQIIMHPYAAAEGERLGDGNSELLRFFDIIQEGRNISLERVHNREGVPSIAFGRKLDNGWYFVLMITEHEYFGELYNMIIITGILGAGLAVALIAMLIRLEKARRKSDDERRDKALQLAEMEKIHEADKRVRLMLDSAPMCIIFWDSDLNVIDCNQEGVNLFELADKDELMKHWYDLSPEYQPDGRKSQDAMREVTKETREKGITRFEWVHQKLNGEEIPCEVTLVIVKYRDTANMMGYIRDLRELKSVLNELHVALDEAKVANKAKSSFLAQMSHEIRTPMNSIMGVTEILMEDELPHDISNGLGIIYNSCSLLLGIINDILDFSKIEAGKMDINLYEYFIASVVNDSANINMMRIGSKKIEFGLQIDENIPARLIGDELRIKQILNNLLSNAFKYTEEGTVSLYISHEEGDGFVTLIMRVTDTGRGMTKQQVDKLFDEYSRFYQGKERNIEGTGLGLTITLSLVKLMGGEISVESEFGVGSVFEVRIPQKAAGDEKLGREVAENLRNLRLNYMDDGRRVQITRDPMPYGHVLIVDDVETNLYVAKGLMRPYELQIDTAMSGFEAIERVENGEVFDIIFMDHMMPEMDGMETVSRLRGMGYTAPIVALTANAVTGQADIFLQNGFDSFISKPIDTRQLNNVLNKLVRDKQPPEVVEKYRNLAKNSPGKSAGGTDGPAQTIDAEIDGLDIARGIEKFGGDTEGYLRILRSYSAGVRSMQSTLEAADNGDINAYRIAVHSVKGMSFDLLADEMGKSAAALEDAAKSGNLEYIRENNSAFLEKLLRLASDIDVLLSSDAGNSGKPVKETPDAEALSKLAAACKMYHMDGADEAMEEINKYQYSGDGGLAQWLQEQLDMADFSAITERLGEYISE